MKFFKFVYTIDLTIIMSIRLSRNERGGFSCGVVCRGEGNGTSDEVGILGRRRPQIEKVRASAPFSIRGFCR